MRKYWLTLLFLTAVTAVMAQKKSVINLVSSKSIQGVKINGVDLLKVYGGVFRQEFSTLQSDSAYIHQADNTFDAFGHVVINQGDTIHIYSDKLNYNDNTKVAILTDNVRMVDKDATLTTNYLTYNTATKFGTYTNGGKLVNKDNTLTSKNGYYFANTRDSYFRYDVVLLSPDAITKTDTLRYNTSSKIAYFYGPTHIYGKKKEKEKDNDTLYTENGNYNTVTEQAFFGKKNLYSQGSKTLKGDSMFYDRKKGFGKVVKNITFNDNEQKMTLMGDLGTFYKADERTVVTENAYGIIVTEEKDTTKNDSTSKKAVTKPPVVKNAVIDTIKAKLFRANKKPQKPVGAGKEPPADDNIHHPANTIPLKEFPKKKPDTIGKKTNKLPDSALTKKDTTRVKYDSVYYTADTLETRMLTYKDYKDLQEKIRLSHIKDTTKRPPSIVYTGPVKYIELSPPKWIQDTTYLHRDLFGRLSQKPDTARKDTSILARDMPKHDLPPPDGKASRKARREKKEKMREPAGPPKPELPAQGNKAAAKPDSSKLSKQDSLKRVNKKPDSVYLTRKINLNDTTRIRILSAFHHVKLFKSDLQGKSDSAFYSTSDSVIRLYVKPIIWTQNSQLSGDTINLQLKNKKFDNIELFPNAFVVNVEKNDSIHFNQAAGKKMRGFFSNDKLERLYIDGNAETIYFSRDSGKVSGMQRSLSSRIKVNFKDGKVTSLTFMAKPEHRYGPLDKFTDDDKILKGFIWKPKERPVSKEAIIPSFNKNKTVKTDKSKSLTTGKPSLNTNAAKDTSSVKPVLDNKLPVIKAGKDTSILKAGQDTIKKAPAQKSPEVKLKKDSATAVQPVRKNQ